MNLITCGHTFVRAIDAALKERQVINRKELHINSLTMYHLYLQSAKN